MHSIQSCGIQCKYTINYNKVDDIKRQFLHNLYMKKNDFEEFGMHLFQDRRRLSELLILK